MLGIVLIVLFIISSSLQPHEMLLLFPSMWDVWGLERLSYSRSLFSETHSWQRGGTKLKPGVSEPSVRANVFHKTVITK